MEVWFISSFILQMNQKQDYRCVYLITTKLLHFHLNLLPILMHPLILLHPIIIKSRFWHHLLLQLRMNSQLLRQFLQLHSPPILTTLHQARCQFNFLSRIRFLLIFKHDCQEQLSHSRNTFFRIDNGLNFIILWIRFLSIEICSYFSIDSTVLSFELAHLLFISFPIFRCLI